MKKAQHAALSQAYICYGRGMVFFFYYLESFSLHLPIPGLQHGLSAVRDLRFPLGCALGLSSAEGNTVSSIHWKTSTEPI